MPQPGFDPNNPLDGGRISALKDVADSLGVIRTEMRAIRSELEERPTSTEVDRHRRVSMFLLLLTLLVAVHAADWHVEHCGPGAETQRVMSAFVEGETDAAALRAAAEPISVSTCDFIFPFHDAHNGHTWPSRANALGILAYLTAAFGLWGWHRHRG